MISEISQNSLKTSNFSNKLVRSRSLPTKATLDVYNYELAPELHASYYSRIHSDTDCRDIVLGNEELNVALDCRTGRSLPGLTSRNEYFS